jgi:hypothetical protein
MTLAATVNPNAFLKPTDPAAAWSDPINYEALNKAIQESATSVRKVSGPATLPVAKGVKAAIATSPALKTQIGGLRAEYATKQKAARQQAERAATNLEMMGAQTQASMQYYAKLQEQAGQRVTESAALWKGVTEKADEYVQSSKDRLADTLGRLDVINTKMWTDMDFSKAHDMQIAVQSSLGTIGAEDRNIAERYGVESPEYASFQNSKKMTLATMQSNLHSTYAKLGEQRWETYLQATNEALYRGNMFINYAEQQHVQTLQLATQSSDAYNMQNAQFQVSVEQLRMAGLENLANWLVETPSFTVDIAPYTTAIAQSLIDYQAQERAQSNIDRARIDEMRRLHLPMSLSDKLSFA